MPKAITIVPKLPKLDRKKRVAAYARVSSGKDAMLHSLSAQISYYNELIQRHDDWIYAGVYADEAKTGTKESRAEFQRLIEDCRAGKIDMVITKSISRFARNTVTLLQTVRMFKSWNVDIYFEEQNINSMSGEGELMMTILASYAQEESRSASENQKWRIKRNFEEGIPWNGALLGYRLQDGQYVIVPEEAEIVRSIFFDYLSGSGYKAIANRLNAENITTRFGNKWRATVISKILTNYTYTGNLLLQKVFRENHITKKTRVNSGELPKYHVESTHEAIIDPDTFLAVQKEKASRAAHFKKNSAQRRAYPFSGILVCAGCGKNYRRKITDTGPVWICSTYNSLGKAACASKRISEDTLYNITAEVLGRSDFTEEILRSRISSIVVCPKNTLIYHLTDGTEVTKEWRNRSRSESWTAEMKETAHQKTAKRWKKNA